jgi:predicted DNA-binding WGR domain protein
MPRLESREGGSSKFWEIEQDGFVLNVRWGRIGANGQNQTKTFSDATEASAAMAKLTAEKISKGYAAASTTQEACNDEVGACAVVATHLPPPLMVACDIHTTQSVPPWLAGGAVIDLPEKLRALLLPSRRFPPPPVTLDEMKAWRDFSEKVKEYGRLDIHGSDPAFQPAMAEAEQRMCLGDLDGSFNSDVVLLVLDAAMECQVGGSGRIAPFVDFLVARKGLPYAIDVLLQAERCSFAWSDGFPHWRTPIQLKEHATEPLSSSWRGHYSLTERAFRAHLARADESVWKQCVEKIQAALPELPASRQPLFGLLLPDLPELSDALALALCAPGAHEATGLLVMTARAPDALAAARAICANPSPNSRIYDHQDMVATLVFERGVDALPILADGAGIEPTDEALTCIGVPEAITLLASGALASTTATSRFVGSVRRWPTAAAAALSELLAGPQTTGLFLHCLCTVMPTADAIEALCPWLSPDAALVLEALADQMNPSEVATTEEMPSFLTNPPWLAARTKTFAPLKLQPLPVAPAEHWEGDSREHALWLSEWDTKRIALARLSAAHMCEAIGIGKDGDTDASKHHEHGTAAILAHDPQALLAAWHTYCESRGVFCHFNALAVAHLPEDMAVAVYNALAEYEHRGAGYVAARYGLRTLPGLRSVITQRAAQELHVALPFAAAELAVPVAHALIKLKTVRRTARRWLLAHPEHAACGLIAPALGKPGEARDCAATALRMLAGHGHHEVLMEVAARYGDNRVVNAMRAMLDEDPLDRYPAKIGPLPAFWNTQGWPRPRLSGTGKPLPDGVLEHIGVMLRFPTTDGVYQGITRLKQLCEPQSLADFAWRLCWAWIYEGAPTKESWAFAAMGLLGNDDTARKLVPHIRAWPGEGFHARAVAGLDVLANIGSDVALMLLNGIAQKAKSKPLQDRARDNIHQIAEARGLTAEELEDRLAPGLGLDSHGSLQLEFGPRQFRVGFDEALKPYVRDQDGIRLPDLPKPKRTDDTELATAAVERFKQLKKDVRTIASQQVCRLEQAMCARRRWDPAQFHQLLVEHPLVRHLVQRVVWGAYRLDDEGESATRLVACFRVAEDGSYSNCADEPFAAPEGEQIRIGIPHPLEMPAEVASSFAQLFADYELLSPFAQLGRESYALNANELATTALKRWKGVRVPTVRVIGLVNKGWRRGRPGEGGLFDYMTKPLADGRVIVLALDPGVMSGMLDAKPEQTLGDVTAGPINRWGDAAHHAQMSALDPITLSELIRDMEALRA